MKNKGITIQQTEVEHKQIRRDFVFVVSLNFILLALMIGLYFWNRSTGALDQMFDSIIKF